MVAPAALVRPFISRIASRGRVRTRSGEGNWTDFSEHDTGGPPQNWTDQFSTGGSRTVVADAASPTGGGKKLQIVSGATDALIGYMWDAVGEPEDVDLVALMDGTLTLANAAAYAGMWTRASGAAASETGFAGYLRSRDVSTVQDVVRIGDYVAGALTVTTAGSEDWTALTDGTKLYMRLRARNGVIQFKKWAYGTSEPAAWTVEDTGESDAQVGKVGLYAFQDTCTLNCYFFSYATGLVDAAPLLNEV